MFNISSKRSFAALLFSITFYAVNGRAQCLIANDLEIKDFTPFGYSSTKQIPLYNPQSVPVKITGAHIDTGFVPKWASFLHIDSSQFPLIIQPLDSSYVSVTLSVPADSGAEFEGYGSYYGSAYVDYTLLSLDTDSSTCPETYSTIELEPFILSSDTSIAIPLFASYYTPIVFYSYEDAVITAMGQLVRFINNGSTPVTVSSRSLLPDSVAFSTPYWGYSSDTVLQGNETFLACIAWNPYQEHMWPDTGEHIVLHFTNGGETQPIPIIFEELGVLEKPTASIQCSIIPNPASGYSLITLNGFTRASIRICDVLGREVKPSVDVLGPNCSTRLSLDNLPSGSYFISVQGVDSGGQNFSQSQPIVVLP
jgi:hypothetical protein